MPTTYDVDEQDRIHERNERRRNRIFKVVEPILWLIVIIIIVAVCLGAIWAMGYFSVPNPIDAIPTFAQ